MRKFYDTYVEGPAGGYTEEIREVEPRQSKWDIETGSDYIRKGFWSFVLLPELRLSKCDHFYTELSAQWGFWHISITYFYD